MKAFLKMGIYACPEAASTLAALNKLENDGIFEKDEKILLYLTGNAMKYLNLMKVERNKLSILGKNASSL